MTPMSNSDARKRLRESVERLETRTHSIDLPRFDGLRDYLQRLDRERAEREFRANPPAWTRPPFRTRAHWIDPPRFTVPAHVFTQEDPMTKHDRHAELVALLTEIRDRLPEPPKVEVNAPFKATDLGPYMDAMHRVAESFATPEPADLTEEPPVGSRVVDCDGDVWERRLDGDWDALTLDDEEMWGMSWEWIRRQAPLRLATEADRERVGIDTAPADDPDETHPLPCNACYGSGSAEIQGQVAEDVDRLRAVRDEWRAMAREADADSKRQYVRAEKAEAERDALRERLNALRVDLSPGGLTWSVYDALRRDDERAKGEWS